MDFEVQVTGLENYFHTKYWCFAFLRSFFPKWLDRFSWYLDLLDTGVSFVQYKPNSLSDLEINIIDFR